MLYKETKSASVGMEVGGAHSTARGDGTTQPTPREGALLCSRNQRVEDQEIAMSLVTPEKIRTLQRKLYIKAKQEPNYRFYSLYDKVYQEELLTHAWRLVRSNGGSPGVDGVTFEVIPFVV